VANNYRKIDYGQSNWTGPLDLMLEAYGNTTADTGWIDLPLVNTVSLGYLSYLKVRAVGESVALRTQFAVGTSGAINIAVIPSNLIPFGFRYLVGFRLGGKGPIQLIMNSDHELIANIPKDAIGQQINCDTVIMNGYRL